MMDPSTQEEELRTLAEELEESEPPILTVQPSVLAYGELKNHQIVGLNWMVKLYKKGLSGILADDMGLGKTIQLISFLAYLRQYRNINGKHLIVTPKSTIPNWAFELGRWLPCCQVVKLLATEEEREETLQNSIRPQLFDVIVTTYEGVNICINQLKKIQWVSVVIDEAHKIKNEQSIIS